MSQGSSGTELDGTKAHNPFDNLLREGDDRIVSSVVAGSPINVRQGGPVVAADGRCGGVDRPRCQQTMSSSKTLGDNTTISSPVSGDLQDWSPWITSL